MGVPSRVLRTRDRCAPLPSLTRAYGTYCMLQVQGRCVCVRPLSGAASGGTNARAYGAARAPYRMGMVHTVCYRYQDDAYHESYSWPRRVYLVPSVAVQLHTPIYPTACFYTILRAIDTRTMRICSHATHKKRSGSRAPEVPAPILRPGIFNYKCNTSPPLVVLNYQKNKRRGRVYYINGMYN